MSIFSNACRSLFAHRARTLSMTMIVATNLLWMCASTDSFAQQHKLKIELIGDSTQTDNAGYGRGFCANLSDVECINMAHGGASTKTFRNDGWWDQAVKHKPDYMLIQFGHNDMESADHAARQTTIEEYEANLRRYINEARAIGAKPILVTPITRRRFGSNGKIGSDLQRHADVTIKVAQSMNVPYIDLHKLSIEYNERIGQEAASKLGISKKDAQGKTIPDGTHFNWAGSFAFGRIVAENLARVAPELQGNVRKSAAEMPGDGRLAMQVYEQKPFKIVLVGDSTVAVQGGWGPGFCAIVTANVTCVDVALNGRSTKSFIDEGAWSKALAENGQYYFIQFGHNDQKDDPKRHTDPETSYAENLHRMIRDVRAHHAIAILVTPLSRRSFDGAALKEDGLGKYAAAAKVVAEQEKVTLVDLNGLSRKYLSGLTQQQADELNAVAHADAKAEAGSVAAPDRTHLNAGGQAFFGRMVADNVVRTQVELGPNVKGIPEAELKKLGPLQAAPTDGK